MFATGALRAQTVYTPYHFITIAGTAGFKGSANGAGAAARFYNPEGIAVDGSGNLFVTDTANNTIRKITPTVAGGVMTWTVTTLAGQAGVSGYSDGTGASAQFFNPNGVYADGSGNIYVDDGDPTVTGLSPLRMITPDGAVTRVATGAATSTGGSAENGPTDPGASSGADQLYYLASRIYVTIPGGDQVYASGANHGNGVNQTEIYEFNNQFPLVFPNFSNPTPAGILGIMMTGPFGGGSADGPGPGATCYGASGIAADAIGNIYVADTLNHLIRKITRSTQGGVDSWNVTTAGGVPLSPGSSDGFGGSARFNFPYGVAVDANGNIYVADTANQTIRMGTPNRAPVAGDGTASAVLGQAITLTLPGTDADGDGLAYAITGTSGGTATVAGDQATYTPSAVGTGTIAYMANDGYATSGIGTITIRTILPSPVITFQASSQTMANGHSVVFNAAATGSPAPTYQWTFNGSMTIPGASVTTDSILMIAGATPANAGTYVCTATNNSGTAMTSATLAVATTSNPGYLTNLSGRGAVGAGAANALFGGFSISGPGSKQLLIRGIGPGLNTFFGLTGGLADPLLTLFNSLSVQISQNDNWGGTSPLSAAQTTLGAFPVPSASADAMLLSSLPSSPYTCQVSGVGAATGVALVELYDADPSPQAARLVNVSVRAPVGVGVNILVGGFVIGGNTSETMLIRAIGPGLASVFGLTGTLAQPVLNIFNSSQQLIYSNTGWGGDPALVSVSVTVGAYAISTSSADSELLITLPPGSYSAQVSGLNNATGIATVEIYEVP